MMLPTGSAMSEARRGHDSFVDALVVHLDRALDGMLSTARQLGDELVNAPTGLPGGNTAYQLVCHCCGVLEFWGGRVIADRSIERDREAEFCARGTVAELEALVAGQRSKFALDTRQLDGAADPRGPLRERDLDRDELRTQAGILLHVYEELAQHGGHLDLTADIVRAQSSKPAPSLHRGLSQLDTPVALGADHRTGVPVLSTDRRISSADVAEAMDEE